MSRELLQVGLPIGASSRGQFLDWGTGKRRIFCRVPRLTTTHGSSPASALRMTVIRDIPIRAAVCVTVSIGDGSAASCGADEEGHGARTVMSIRTTASSASGVTVPTSAGAGNVRWLAVLRTGFPSAAHRGAGDRCPQKTRAARCLGQVQLPPGELGAGSHGQDWSVTGAVDVERGGCRELRSG
jgi:hypothetical protein